MVEIELVEDTRDCSCARFKMSAGFSCRGCVDAIVGVCDGWMPSCDSRTVAASCCVESAAVATPAFFPANRLFLKGLIFLSPPTYKQSQHHPSTNPANSPHDAHPAQKTPRRSPKTIERQYPAHQSAHQYHLFYCSQLTESLLFSTTSSPPPSVRSRGGVGARSWWYGFLDSEEGRTTCCARGESVAVRSCCSTSWRDVMVLPV